MYTVFCTYQDCMLQTRKCGNRFGGRTVVVQLCIFKEVSCLQCSSLLVRGTGTGWLFWEFREQHRKESPDETKKVCSVHPWPRL
jgi:hypothetical protein